MTKNDIKKVSDFLTNRREILRANAAITIRLIFRGSSVMYYLTYSGKPVKLIALIDHEGTCRIF